MSPFNNSKITIRSFLNFHENSLAYVRVSTKEQAEKGLSTPAQLKAIR